MGEEKTKAELLDEAKDLDVEGRSSMKKDELAEAVEEAKAEAEPYVKTPLVKQAPSERIMTGATSEEEAKKQEALLKNKPEDYVGDVSEAGFDEDGNPA